MEAATQPAGVPATGRSCAGSRKGGSSRTLALRLQKVRELGEFSRRRSQRL